MAVGDDNVCVDVGTINILLTVTPASKGFRSNCREPELCAMLRSLESELYAAAGDVNPSRDRPTVALQIITYDESLTD